MSEMQPHKRFEKIQNYARNTGISILLYLGLFLMVWGIGTGIATVFVFAFLVYTGFTDPSVTFGRTVSNIGFLMGICGGPAALCILGWKIIESYTGPILAAIISRSKQNFQWQPTQRLVVKKTEIRVIKGGREVVDEIDVPEE